MDLSKLSEADLQALSNNEWGSVSDVGLQHLAGHKGSFASSAIGGVAKGAMDLVEGGAQLLYHALPQSVRDAGDAANNWLAENTGVVGKIPERNLSSIVTGRPTGLDALVQKNEAEYQQARRDAGKTGFDWARLGGNVAATSALPFMRLAAPAKMLPRIAQSAAQGAAISGLQPVTQGDFADEKLSQVGTGAAVAGLLAPIAGGLARIVRPNTSADVTTLMKAGVTPTPGQIMGGRAQVLEDKLQSLPILGDAISAARKRGLDAFNKAAYSRATAGVAATPQTVGHEGVAAVKQALGNAYDELLPKTRTVLDAQFKSEMDALMSAAAGLPAKEAKVFNDIINREVYQQAAPNGGMMGEVMKRVESQLGKEVKRFSGANDAYQQKVGDALRQAQEILRQTVARQNPELAQELATINKGYANYARIRDAASRSGSDRGVFTPAQLAASVRSADKSVGKGATATGNAFMQDLSGPAKSVLASRYPDSGTAGRLMTDALAAGGLGYVSPGTLLGVGAASLPYLPYLDKATAFLLTQRPEFANQAAQFIRQSAPLLTVPTVGLLNQ